MARIHFALRLGKGSVVALTACGRWTKNNRRESFAMNQSEATCKRCIPDDAVKAMGGK